MSKVSEQAWSACPVVESMVQFGSKWRLLVLHDLRKMYFVGRRLAEDASVATYYSLTENGSASSQSYFSG